MVVEGDGGASGGEGGLGVGGGVWREEAGGFEAALGGGGFNFRVDFCAQQQHEAGDVEPREQDDDSAQ